VKNKLPDNITIQQYLQGAMDKEGMHELEKQALDEPFLSDALDGYCLITEPDHGLSILQLQLHRRIMLQQENKKVFDLSWQRLSVAAAAAVMFISAGVLFWMNNQVPVKKLAYNNKQTEVVLSKADTLAADRTTVNIAQTSLEAKSVPSLATVDSSNVAAKPELKTTTENSKRDDAATITSQVENSAVANDLSLNININQDNSRLSLPNSKVLDSAQVAPEASGLKNTSTENISRFSANSSNLKLNALISAQPINGWDLYKKYIQDEVANSTASLNEKGNVIVGFKVDDQGKLSNLKILKSLSAKADSLALKIVRSGPAWKASVTKQISDQQIDVTF